MQVPSKPNNLMQMKAKNFFFFYAGIIALILGLSVGFYSCDDDDDNNPIDNSLSIDSFTPSTGQVGDTITITGTGFNTTGSQYNTVTFTDNITATIIEVTGTTLKVKVPEGAVSGPISVTVDGEFATSSASFTLDDSPVLESLSPVNGYVGTEVTLAGNNFGENAEAIKIYFGDSLAVVSAITNTSIVTAMPAHDPEVVEVKVVLNDKTSNTLEFTIDKTPVNVQTVYWTSSSGIYKGDITEGGGANITELYQANTSTSSGIEVDYENRYVYWVSAKNGGTLHRARIDDNSSSSTPDELFNNIGGYPNDLAIDSENGHFYITIDDGMGTGHYILSGNLDGNGELKTLYHFEVDLNTWAPFPYGIKLQVANGNLYWAEMFSGSVMMGSVEGETAQEAVELFNRADDGLKYPSGIAIDAEAGKIYITDAVSMNEGGTAVDNLYVGNLNGSGSLEALIEPGDNLLSPMDIEIDTDNGYIYWINTTDNLEGTVMYAKTDKSEGPKSLFSGEKLFGAYFFDLDIR